MTNDILDHAFRKLVMLDPDTSVQNTPIALSYTSNSFK